MARSFSVLAIALVYLGICLVASAQTKKEQPKTANTEAGIGFPTGGTLVSSFFVVMPERPCGYGVVAATQDKDGTCRQEFDLHAGPPNADCRFVTSEDGKVLKIVCTWKPEATK
jgi:hypothetical protein